MHLRSSLNNTQSSLFLNADRKNLLAKHHLHEIKKMQHKVAELQCIAMNQNFESIETLNMNHVLGCMQINESIV